MNIPTAEELFEKYHWTGSFEEGGFVNVVDREDFEKALLDFARLHVAEALHETLESISFLHYNATYKDIKEIFLNAYPLTNIK
jgi:hypothetical protein